MSDINLPENSIANDKSLVDVSLISSVQVDAEVLVRLALVNILYESVEKYIENISNLHIDRNVWPPIVRLISTNARFDILCVQLFGDQYLSNNPGVHFAFGYMKLVLSSQIDEFKAHYINDVQGDNISNISASFLSHLDQIFKKRFGHLSKGTRCGLHHEGVCDHCRACLSFITEAFIMGHGLAAEFFEINTASSNKYSNLQKFGLGTGKSFNPLLHLADKLSITQQGTNEIADLYIILNVNRYDFVHHRVLPFVIYHYLVCSLFIRPNQPSLEFNQVFIYWMAKEFLRFSVGANYNAQDPQRISSIKDAFTFYNDYVESLLDNLALQSTLVTKFREIASKFLAFIRHEYIPFIEVSLNETDIDRTAWQVIRRFCVDLILSDIPNNRICRSLIYFDGYYLTSSSDKIVECFVIEPILRDLDESGIRQGLIDYFAHQPEKQVNVKLDTNARKALRALLIDAFNDAWDDTKNVNGIDLILQLERIGQSYNNIIIYLLQKDMNVGQPLSDIVMALLELDDEDDLHEKENTDMENPMLIEFLIEIGLWAKNELSERWALRRKKENEKPPIDLSNDQEVRQEAPAELPSLSATEVEQLERTKELIGKMRTLIYEWTLEIQEVDEELNKRRIDPPAARRVKTELEGKIENKIKEIPVALNRIGLDIEREKLN